MYISNIELKKLIDTTTELEKLELSKLLDDERKTAYSNQELLKQIVANGSYLKLLVDIAKKLDVETKSDYNKLKPFDDEDSLMSGYSHQQAVEKCLQLTMDLEQKITIKLLGSIYENMSQEDKALFDKNLKDVAEKNGYTSHTSLAGTAGLLVLGNMGGFATYTFLTTIMSSLSFGLLGFGAYTAATSLLSVLLGPIGWLGLGFYALYKLSEPNYKKLIPIVVTIGIIRYRINSKKSSKHDTPKVAHKFITTKSKTLSDDLQKMAMYYDKQLKENKDEYTKQIQDLKKKNILSEQEHALELKQLTKIADEYTKQIQDLKKKNILSEQEHALELKQLTQQNSKLKSIFTLYVLGTLLISIYAVLKFINQ